jgi:hypothetical protein
LPLWMARIMPALVMPTAAAACASVNAMMLHLPSIGVDLPRIVAGDCNDVEGHYTRARTSEKAAF